MLSKEDRDAIEARDAAYSLADMRMGYRKPQAIDDRRVLLAALADAERERDEAQAKVVVPALAWDFGYQACYEGKQRYANPYRAALDSRS